MENKKTEKKRIFSKLTVCVAALALVSCAFVGGTFARYTTSGESASSGPSIADWYIDVADGSGSADGTFTISPSGVGYDSDNRVNTADEGGAILTFVNRGEVDADVTITQGNTMVVYQKVLQYNTDGTLKVDQNGKPLWSEVRLEAGETYTDNDGHKFTWRVGEDTSNITMNPKFEEPKRADYDSDAAYDAACDEVDDLLAAWQFSAGPYLYATGSNESNSIIKPGTISVPESGTGNEENISVTQSGNKWTFTLAPGQEISVMIGKTTWTSDFGTTSDQGVAADLLDTWIGENISKMGYSFTWTAEQSSTLPE